MIACNGTNIVSMTGKHSNPISFTHYLEPVIVQITSLVFVPLIRRLDLEGLEVFLYLQKSTNGLGQRPSQTLILLFEYLAQYFLVADVLLHQPEFFWLLPNTFF